MTVIRTEQTVKKKCLKKIGLFMGLVALQVCSNEALKMENVKEEWPRIRKDDKILLHELRHCFTRVLIKCKDVRSLTLNVFQWHEIIMRICQD